MTVRNSLLLGATSLALLAPATAWANADEAPGDIIVTAERTDRSLRETSASVSVTTADDLESLAGAYGTDDVASRIPNLVSSRPSSTAPAVRGIDGTGPGVGADAFFAGTRPRLSYQVDNRTLTHNEAIYIDGLLWDVQQVEVYRGPQSTLQGRNAIAGVIAVKTTDPGFAWSGRIRGMVGEDDLWNLSGAIGGPIASDVLAFRIAADWRTDESFAQFSPFTARDVGLSENLKEIENPGKSRSLAVRGKLLFTPSPDVRALITLSHTDAFAPQTADVVRPFEEHVAAFPQQPRFRTRANVAIANTDFRLADGLSLAVLGTASDFRVERFSPLFEGNALIDGREYTLEPRLRFGSAADRISGFVAGLLFDARQDEEIDIFASEFEDRTRTHAVFGELAVKADPGVTVTLGARYESEERDRTGGQGLFAIDFHRSFEAFLPRLTVAVDAGDSVTVGATVGRGYNAGGAGFSFVFPFESYTYDKEMVWNYEGFVRASLADGRLDLQGNIFFNDYDGLQLPFDLNPAPELVSTVIRNAERATTYGAELSASYRPVEELSLFVNAGLLKTRINRYDDPAIEGNDLARAPAFSLNAGFAFKPVRPLELSFDMRYTDAYYSDVFNDARGRTKPYNIANAQIAWETGPARLFVAATNLFNTTDVTLLMPGTTYADDVATITRPRRVTAGVELRF